jgi:hypothetical protein
MWLVGNSGEPPFLFNYKIMDLTKLKPFDRKAAKEGAKLVTREGRKVIYYHDSGLDIKYPIVAYLEGQASGQFWLSNGKVYEGEENYYDLFIAPETHEYWAFKYRDGLRVKVVGNFNSKEDALKCVKFFNYKIIGKPFCVHLEEI